MFEAHISKHSLFSSQDHGRLNGVHISKHSRWRHTQDHGRLSIVRISKHSLFSWRRHSQDHGRLSEVLWCVGVLCVVWVQEGVFFICLSVFLSLSPCDVVCCVVWCVAWWWCCVVCGVWVFYFSLFSLSLFLSCSFLLLSCLPLSLLSSSSFSSLFPSHQQTLCKALINKRDVQLWGVCLSSSPHPPNKAANKVSTKSAFEDV